MYRYCMVYSKFEKANGSMTRTVPAMMYRAFTRDQESRSNKAMTKWNGILTGTIAKRVNKTVNNAPMKKHSKKTMITVEINGVKYTQLLKGYKFNR